MKTKSVDNAIRRTANYGFKVDRDGQLKCRVCSCTETRPCNPPCGWFGNSDLCTGCADAIHALLDWREGAHRANLTALLREVRYWEKHGTQQMREREVRRNTRLVEAAGGGR